MSNKAKQEAERLIERFRTAHSEKLSDYTFIEYPTAKVLALICVEEISKHAPYLKQYPPILDEECVEYWDEVKKQIQEL